MVRGMLALVMVGCWMLAGCGEAGVPVPASGTPVPTGTIDADLVEAIALSSYQTSPPGHPSLEWPELAPQIEAARRQLDQLPNLAQPGPPSDPLAARATSSQVRGLAEARRRAMVLRAESARLLAAGDPDGAAVELEGVLDLAQQLSTWGVPAAAETAAEFIGLVLDAMDQPDVAPMTIALSTISGARLRIRFEALDANDPAGRMRALTESAVVRIEAMRSRARGVDGPTAVRGVAGRYVSGAALGTLEEIDHVTQEAYSFSRALADGWEKPSRSAITQRLRHRQEEDTTGVLVVLLGDAAEACDDDARLRERIAGALESLR